MKFARLLPASLLFAACASISPFDELPDAGEPRDAAALGDASLEPKVEPKAPRPRSVRTPWLDASDPVGQKFPAYGVTLYHMSYVYEAPSKKSRVVGYLRRGARFRASEEVTRKECARGWFEIPGNGFVCNGDGYVVDSKPPGYAEGPAAAALSDPLPYPYAKVVAHDVPQYVRPPTPAEEHRVMSAFAATPVAAPEVTEEASAAVATQGPSLPTDIAALLRLRMQPGFYVSVDVAERSEALDFTRTVRGGYVRTEQLVEAKLPAGIGVSLGNRLKLPVAFVYRGGAPALRLHPVTGEAVKVGYDLPNHSAHALSGEVVVRAGRRYYVTEEGLLLRDTAVRVVEKVARPKLVPKNERWIRVDLKRQTLTAYEGEEPVFATLVSSGLSEHPTPVGMFRLHAKHVTATMADSLAADGPYSIEDVPWTMYFSGSYALHAAFWHDRFGHPRSHGCVNLSPRDARWLFFWTAPNLPSSWHGILAGVGKGTTVVLDSDVASVLEGS